MQKSKAVRTKRALKSSSESALSEKPTVEDNSGADMPQLPIRGAHVYNDQANCRQLPRSASGARDKDTNPRATSRGVATSNSRSTSALHVFEMSASLVSIEIDRN